VLLHANAHFRTQCFNLFSPPASQPPLRLCNGHAPLIIQEGRARAGQYVQPRQGGQSSDLNSSIAQGKGGGSGQGSQSVSQSHSQALLFLHGFHGLPFLVLFFSSHFLTSLRSCGNTECQLRKDVSKPSADKQRYPTNF
jgi:hypothetical protein